MPEADPPGRGCPLHYRYAPAALRPPARLRADALYVVGGLYGNVPALERVLAMRAAEPGDARLVFNGDFNWFNVDRDAFVRINETVLQHAATRGNVETELAHDDDAHGCGCAYPASVADEVVERSNRIMQALRRAAHAFAPLRRSLAALPMHLVAAVGDVNVAIVHGDAESLAGWSFAHEALSAPEGERHARACLEAAGVALIASTHTCLPVVKPVALPDGPGAIVNNGSAGMPNLRGTRYGLITRVATSPAMHPSSFGLRVRGVYVDLLPVEYDQARWVDAFLRNWPPGSPAHLSYFDRIADGPSFSGPVLA